MNINNQIMTAIVKWVAIIFKENIMLEVINTIFYFESLEIIDLKYPSVFLILTVSNKQLIILFTFDNSLIQHLHLALTEGIEYSEEELQNITEAVAADMLNIIIGNATADMPNNGNLIKITPPQLIKNKKQLLRKQQAQFFAAEVITSVGRLWVSSIEPIELFNENLDYINN